MGETVLLSILAVFVLISAIALCIQAVYLAGVYKTVRLLQQKVVPLVPKVESLVEATRSTVELTKKQIGDISTKTHEILDSAKGQVAKMDDIVTDAAGRARAQMERIEMVLDDTMSRIQETVVVIHSGVMKPLRQIDGIARAIRAIFWHLFGRRRPSPAQATSDEEMFI